MTNASQFDCRICVRDISVLTHGHHEALRHFQSSKLFPRDQRLRLETPGLEVLDYEGNAMSPGEVEQQRENIMRAPLLVRDREYPSSEDVLVDDTGVVDPNLWIMSKVSSLIEVLHLGGSYELVYQLWAQLTLSAVRVNMDVTWSRSEVLVIISICAVLSSTWDLSSDFVSVNRLGKITQDLQRGVRRTRQRCADLSSHLG